MKILGENKGCVNFHEKFISKMVSVKKIFSKQRQMRKKWTTSSERPIVNQIRQVGDDLRYHSILGVPKSGTRRKIYCPYFTTILWQEICKYWTRQRISCLSCEPPYLVLSCLLVPFFLVATTRGDLTKSLSPVWTRLTCAERRNWNILTL